jgi:hypothetical protein
MQKIRFFLLAALLQLPVWVIADEGMWLLPLIQQLNIQKMQQMGLKLSAEDIYSINHSSLKDAVVALDQGSCTAELVSADGLLLTNHHCGFSEIQSHSSVEHDYLTNGFWAYSRDQELANPGKSATFLIRIEDVSDQILPSLTYDMDEGERQQKVKELASEIEAKATEDNKYEASVQSFFEGNKYYLLVTQTFNDIRLVGAPPSSIGKYGGDTDNWMWPRHTGDFSIFRIYCAPDGSPAEYAPENVPFHPAKFLPVSIKGVNKGDFAMVLGYPGNTDRYLTSYGIRELLEVTHPNRILIRGLKQELWTKDMKSDPKIRIQYADKYSTSSNYWKFSIGQQKGLTRLNVLEQRQKQEADFTAWLAENSDRASKYGNALTLMKDAYTKRKEMNSSTQFLFEAFYSGIEIMQFSLVVNRLYMTLQSMPDSVNLIASQVAEIKKGMAQFYKDFNLPTDKKVAAAMIKLYYEKVPAEYHPDIYDKIKKSYKGDIEKYVNDLYAKTVFSTPEKFTQFLDKPTTKKLDKDPVFELTRSFLSTYFSITGASASFDENLNRGRRLYLAGLMEMQKDRVFCPDANSTMRLTYGTVGDYKPMDAVFYDYKTTLTGVMEKEDPNNDEFIVDPKLKELYQKKDFGRYANGGDVPVCFTTNNDITGGNSGSPVINANGELIGLAFDGNWEAMSGDIQFENNLQKCICVDIRYVLFIIDKLAGAQNLINEMTVIE